METDIAQRDRQCAVDHYINPAIGSTNLAKLSPADVDRMIRAAPTVKTGNYARRVLRIALNRAIKRGEVHRNAATRTDNRRTEKHDAQFLTLDQAKALLAAVADGPYEALYAVAMRSDSVRVNHSASCGAMETSLAHG